MYSHYYYMPTAQRLGTCCNRVGGRRDPAAAHSSATTMKSYGPSGYRLPTWLIMGLVVATNTPTSAGRDRSCRSLPDASRLPHCFHRWVPLLSSHQLSPDECWPLARSAAHIRRFRGWGSTVRLNEVRLCFTAMPRQGFRQRL